MSLAGGLSKGDRVSIKGAPATVLGPPSRPAAASISVAVRFDDGRVLDVRVVWEGTGTFRGHTHGRDMDSTPSVDSIANDWQTQWHVKPASRSGPPLAGGYFRDDRVVHKGILGTVVGKPARAALANLSVSVRLDNGNMIDARVNDLELQSE